MRGYHMQPACSLSPSFDSLPFSFYKNLITENGNKIFFMVINKIKLNKNGNKINTNSFV